MRTKQFTVEIKRKVCFGKNRKLANQIVKEEESPEKTVGRVTNENLSIRMYSKTGVESKSKQRIVNMKVVFALDQKKIPEFCRLVKLFLTKNGLTKMANIIDKTLAPMPNHEK